MFVYMDRFFPVLLELLSDSAEDVLMLDIMLITDICGQPNQNLDLKSLNLTDEISQEVRDTKLIYKSMHSFFSFV